VNEDGKIKVKKINGAFPCPNPDCILFKYGKQTQSRDRVLALAGCSKLIFGAFDHTLDPSNTAIFKKGI
jgi:hypothetical protein